MPATRSRTSTEQPAEVAAEEVKQVQDDGSEIVAAVAAQPDDVKAVETAVVPDEPAAAAEPVPAAAEEPAAAVPEAVTNGSAEPVADTNGASEVAAVAAGTNGATAAVANGVAAEVPADESVPEAASVTAETAVDGKRKSEAGDGDAVPDSTDVKKQKVAETLAEAAAEEAVDATA